MSDRREYQAKWKKKRTQERLEAGLCKACGKAPPLPGMKYCENCRERNINYHKQRRAELLEMSKEWRAAGLCSKCGKAVLPGRKVCAEHYQGYLDVDKPEPKKEHTDTIAKINEEARAMGLSYGKYQLLKQLGKI